MPARVVLLLAFVLLVVLGWAASFANRHFEAISAGIEALPPREFESPTLVFVGTGGAYENHLRRGPCAAVGVGTRVILVDAGRAVAEGLRSARIPVSQPDTVLLTSLLPENVVGLDDLVLTGWLAPRTASIRVIGPPGTRRLVENLLEAHGEAIRARGEAFALPEAGARVDAVEVEDGFLEDDAGIRLSSAALPGGPVPALAWRVEAGDRAFVVGGTGWGTDALVGLAQGAEVLVHEALLFDSLDAAIEAGALAPDALRREAELHTPLRAVGELASRSGVGTLALIRLRPPPFFDHQFTRIVAETFGGRIVIAKDGGELTP